MTERKEIMEYLIVILKTLIFYFILILILRIMGKREVGELSVFDVVVFFVISDLFSLSLNGEEAGKIITIFNALVPIAVIVTLQVITSYVALKSEKIRNLIDGVPCIIIKNGNIDQKTMKKQRYNLDDLLSQLRLQGIDSIEKVAFAILEATGDLTIIEKEKCNCDWPLPLVKDGIINEATLQEYGNNKEWLYNELRKQGYKSCDNIFLVLALKDGLRVIEKQTLDNKK